MTRTVRVHIQQMGTPAKSGVGGLPLSTQTVCENHYIVTLWNCGRTILLDRIIVLINGNDWSNKMPEATIWKANLF